MTQYARPSADNTVGSWTTTPLYSKTNDSSDTTFIVGPSGASTACEIQLSSVTDPAVSTNHVLTVRAKVGNGASGPEQLTYSLYQGATLVAASAGTSISRTTITDYSTTLTGTQADAITDYADLRIRLAQTSVATGEYINVYEAYLAVPDATSGPVNVNAGNSAGTGASSAPTPNISVVSA